MPAALAAASLQGSLPAWQPLAKIERPRVAIANSIPPFAQASASTARASTRALREEASDVSPSLFAARDLTSGLGSRNADKSDSLVNACVSRRCGSRCLLLALRGPRLFLRFQLLDDGLYSQFHSLVGPAIAHPGFRRKGLAQLRHGAAVSERA